MASEASISASDWLKGITLSIAASIIGGASKLAIRKSWLMVENLPELDATSLLPLLGFPNTFTDRIYSKSNHDIDDANSININQNISDTSKSQEHIELPAFQQQQQPPSQTFHEHDSESNSSLQYNDIVQNTLSDNSLHLQRRSVILRLCGMFGMTVLNPACCVWAMVYASPSVLAPFSGLTLVWIVLFSEYFVNERPLPRQILAAALIILGEVITAIFGDHTNDNNTTLDQIRQSYEDKSFIAFFFALLLWLLLLGAIIHYSSSSTLKRFAWGVSGGSVTGLQNFLKDGLTALSVATPGEPYPFFMYLFLLGGLSSALIGLLLLTACMKRYDATYSSSMFVGSFVISASIMAAIHYDTFQNLESTWNYIFYPFGLLVLLSGVLVLAFAPKPSAGEDTSTFIVNQHNYQIPHNGSDILIGTHYSHFEGAA